MQDCRVSALQYLHDDECVQFYTGLPNLKILKVVFEFVAAAETPSCTKLTPFQELMVVKVNLSCVNAGFSLSFPCFHLSHLDQVDYSNECPVERPSNLVARVFTWSSYKHHNTIKLLIGITPQGVISFLSDAWGGRVSDKYLTEHSGILDKRLPGDIVLADRGFDISDSVGLHQAKLHIPAFTKGKDQLSAIEIEETHCL